MGINDQDLKEYVVALHRIEDLEPFYDDMETPGGSLYIPNRTVDLAKRRPSSPNTHYYLTDQEAEQLRLDPRVRAVTIPIDQQTLVKRKSLWTQTSDNWYKGHTSSIQPFISADKNWALLRCVEGSNRLNWGRNGTQRVSGTAYTDANGKNVDVIICDGLFRQNHAEFAKNPDGTGGFRSVPFNWFQYSKNLGLNTATNYNYSGAMDNHAAHVAGTACGITQGWARESNIYNIDAFGANGMPDGTYWDYILEFHKNKPINPVTGTRNPTVVNYSVGLVLSLPIYWLTALKYRTRPRLDGTLWSKQGFISTTSTGQRVSPFFYEVGLPLGAQGESQPYVLDIPVPDTNGMADAENLINNGIHIVMAGGNEAIAIDLPGGVDYNNFINWRPFEDVNTPWGKFAAGSSQTLYYCRRHSCQTEKAIVVGELDSTVTTQIGAGSARGPGIDIFAPGTGIVSAISSTTASTALGTATSKPDPRFKNSDRIDAYFGTSMASPQVAGMIACFLEKDPTMSPADMKNYVIGNAKIGQITNKTGTTELDYLYNMQNAPNRFLFYPQIPGGGGGSTTDGGSTSQSSTSSSTSTSTSTTTTTTTTTTTLGPYFNLTVTPGTNISEGDTVQICLNVNPNFTPNGTKIPFIFNINPL